MPEYESSQDISNQLLKARAGSLLDGLETYIANQPEAIAITNQLRQLIEMVSTDTPTEAEVAKKRSGFLWLLSRTDISLESSDVDSIEQHHEIDDNELYKKATEEAERDLEYQPENVYFQERIDAAKAGLAYAYAEIDPSITESDFRAYKIALPDAKDLDAAFIVLSRKNGLPVESPEELSMLRHKEIYDRIVDTGRFATHEAMNQLYVNRPVGSLNLDEMTLLTGEQKRLYAMSYTDPNDILTSHHGQLAFVERVKLGWTPKLVFRPSVVVCSNPHSIDEPLVFS